jgi:hypothetical protein
LLRRSLNLLHVRAVTEIATPANSHQQRWKVPFQKHSPVDPLDLQMPSALLYCSTSFTKLSYYIYLFSWKNWLKFRGWSQKLYFIKWCSLLEFSH